MNISGNIGMGHTRWATHGEPNQVNSHPHCSEDGKLSIVHNGIIENYDSIKKALIDKGHTFKSETDTEVLIHLIEEIKKQEQVTLFEAIRLALNEVIGAYAIVIMEEGVNNMLDKLKDWADYVPPFVWYILVFILGYITGSL